ncbi:unnamed protein product [Didymodactylos carnosus]|uniref:Uncharacterized protein n=1 Tax=Didymodactylos carnosus TaxID=1234261 RepID=A0A815HUZ6_9BILA|nr:unnamed protein product [Didymodactylos carnosus]CAF1358993.1 unnamed protein product [Didymodactylos carnosus]CAF4087560.1 unnamed protein product [Didymodactylos carnosus]CAF4235787.1 unnamed protein product [Didymodactylos carnosus]
MDRYLNRERWETLFMSLANLKQIRIDLTSCLHGTIDLEDQHIKETILPLFNNPNNNASSIVPNFCAQLHYGKECPCQLKHVHLQSITARTDKANLIRTKEESEINEQRVNGSYQSVSAYVGIRINGICNVTGPITLGNVSRCGTGNGCSTPVLIKSQTSGFLADHPLRYVQTNVHAFVQHTKIKHKAFFRIE